MFARTLRTCLRAVRSEGAPLMVWTGVSLAGEAGGRVGILTLGLHGMLGLPEMLISAPRSAGDDALLFLLDMVGYVVDRGAALPDGDTIGRSATEKLKVRYVASPLKPGEKVARIELP